jgi:hypothetical protein
VLEQFEVAAGEAGEGAEVQILGALGAGMGHGQLECGLEGRGRTAVYHLGILLDQAPVGVPHQARVAGHAQETAQGGVGEADIEDGVHHAGHGHRRAGADRHQQGLAAGAELQPAGRLQTFDLALQQLAQGGSEGLRIRAEGLAEGGAEHEGLGHRQADGRHAGQVEGLEAHGFHRAFETRAGQADAVEMSGQVHG